MIKQNGDDERNEDFRLTFVAYVYPGWHRTPYRPAVDEWDLLASFHPYFPGHERPPEPRGGRYDDSQPETAARHVSTARAAGIEAFNYFMYYQHDYGFVMDEPMMATFHQCDLNPGFSVAGTWCIRLPHNKFPIPIGDQLEPQPQPDAPSSLVDKPIETLTIRDLEQLIGPDDAVWREVTLGDGADSLVNPNYRSAFTDNGRSEP